MCSDKISALRPYFLLDRNPLKRVKYVSEKCFTFTAVLFHSI
jgi:hypothetical protein